MRRSRFKKQLFKRHSKRKELTPDGKLLNALARILELNNACTAISVYDGKVLAAANAISDGPNNTALYKTIDAALRYFSRIAERSCKKAPSTPAESNSHDTEEGSSSSGGEQSAGTSSTNEEEPDVSAAPSEPSELELLADICRLSIQVKEIPTTALNKEQISAFIKYIISDEKGQLRQKDEIRRAMDKCTVSMLIGRSKPPEALKGITGRATGKQLAAILVVIAERSYDFFRVKEGFENPTLSTVQAMAGDGYEVVEGKGSMHAEMRIIQYIFDLKKSAEGKKKTDSKSKEEVPIGISKLCCPDCWCAVLAVNGHGLDLNTSQTRQAPGRAALIRPKRFFPKFSTPGSHGLPFTENWIKPDFLTGPLFTSYKRFFSALEKAQPGVRANMAQSDTTHSPARSPGVTVSRDSSLLHGALLANAGLAGIIKEIGGRPLGKVDDVDEIADDDLTKAIALLEGVKKQRDASKEPQTAPAAEYSTAPPPAKKRALQSAAEEETRQAAAGLAASGMSYVAQGDGSAPHGFTAPALTTRGRGDRRGRAGRGTC